MNWGPSLWGWPGSYRSLGWVLGAEAWSNREPPPLRSSSVAALDTELVSSKALLMLEVTDGARAGSFLGVNCVPCTGKAVPA